MFPLVTPAERLAGLQHVAGADCDRHSLQTAFLSPASISAPGNLQACLLCVPAENSEACFWPSAVFTDKCLGATRPGPGLGELIVISTTIALPSMILSISLPITPSQRLADVQSTMAEGADCPMRCSKDDSACVDRDLSAYLDASFYT
jgi:hypothetical protein